MVRPFRTVRLAFVLLACVAFGQTDRATLRGTITDPTGALVPAADVCIVEVGTNIEARGLPTDENGNHEAPGLKPGVYKISVDKAGFKNNVAENLPPRYPA